MHQVLESYTAINLGSDKNIPQYYQFVMGIYLDFQKAFNAVDHSILLWKLNNIME